MMIIMIIMKVKLSHWEEKVKVEIDFYNIET